MDRVCLYGPLAHDRVLAALKAQAQARDAVLPDAALTGGDCIVPGLADVAGGRVPARLVAGSDGIASLAATLGLTAARRRLSCDGEAVDATVYLPQMPDAAPWEDADHLGWGAILGEAVPELLDEAATRGTEAARQRLPMILSRAASRATAAAAAPKPAESGLSLADVTLHERRRPYSNYFAVEELVYSHARFDGTDHPPVLRAVFMASDAVTVLPYDPVRDRVLLVEQVRAGPIARGDANAWILEPVAGRIEPGHTPEATARKEAQEEAGLTLQALHLIGDYYPSTGCFSEYLYSYIAIADLPDTAAGLGGVLAEGEDIRAHILPRTELLARVDRNEIPDAPLILSVYWLERHLDRLRSGG